MIDPMKSISKAWKSININKYIYLITILLLYANLVVFPTEAEETDMASSFTDKWSLLEVRDEATNLIWFFRKNTGINEFKEKHKYPILIYFTVKYKPDDETGLPGIEDTQILYEFEEKFIPIIEAESNSYLVASVMKEGIKDHLFYVSDSEMFMESIKNYTEYLTGFSIETESQYDPKWLIYSDFPGDAD